MASNFFAQRKRKSRIDLTAEEPTNKTQTSDTKKKYSKFVQLNNFTKDNVNERVNNLIISQWIFKFVTVHENNLFLHSLAS